MRRGLSNGSVLALFVFCAIWSVFGVPKRLFRGRP